MAVVPIRLVGPVALPSVAAPLYTVPTDGSVKQVVMRGVTASLAAGGAAPQTYSYSIVPASQSPTSYQRQGNDVQVQPGKPPLPHDNGQVLLPGDAIWGSCPQDRGVILTISGVAYTPS